MQYVYGITIRSLLLTIRTKLQIKYRATLYQHEIKEWKRVMSILFPLIS